METIEIATIKLKPYWLGQLPLPPTEKEEIMPMLTDIAVALADQHPTDRSIVNAATQMIAQISALTAPNQQWIWKITDRTTGEYLGCIWCHSQARRSDVLYTDYTFLIPAARGRGIAYYASAGLAYWASTHGFKYSQTHVNPANKAAIALHERMEYTKIGDRLWARNIPTSDEFETYFFGSLVPINHPQLELQFDEQTGEQHDLP